MKVLLCILVICIASTSATFGNLFGNLLGGGDSDQSNNIGDGIKQQFVQPQPPRVQRHLVKVIHESSPRVHYVKLVHGDHNHGHGVGDYGAIQTVKLVHAAPLVHYSESIPVVQSGGWSYGPALHSPWD